MKNYSLLRRENKTELSPAYDLLNTTIIIGGNPEESALTLNGKKKNLIRSILIDYLAKERLQMSLPVINKTLLKFSDSMPLWENLIDNSFLDEKNKTAYKELLSTRKQIIGL